MSEHAKRWFEQWRRTWYRWHGEKVVSTTFWPGDYRLGQDYMLAGRRYRITRYLRATHPDGRFFEVWGHVTDAVQPQAGATSFRHLSEHH